MTDAPTPPTPPATPPVDPPADRGTIRSILADELGKLLSGGKAAVVDDPAPAAPATAAGKQDDIAAQVRKALKDVNAEQQEKTTLSALVNDVTQLKASQQRPPKPKRRIETLMGWHRDEDD